MAARATPARVGSLSVLGKKRTTGSGSADRRPFTVRVQVRSLNHESTHCAHSFIRSTRRAGHSRQGSLCVRDRTLITVQPSDAMHAGTESVLCCSLSHTLTHTHAHSLSLILYALDAAGRRRAGGRGSTGLQLHRRGYSIPVFSFRPFHGSDTLA